jgi:hypothetical protein
VLSGSAFSPLALRANLRDAGQCDADNVDQQALATCKAVHSNSVGAALLAQDASIWTQMT